MTAGSAPAFSATFGSNNRMVGYSYDNNGNQLTTPDGATLEYDWDNRVTKWTKQGKVELYQYHPAGWRLSNWMTTFLHGPGGQLLTANEGGPNAGYTDYVYFGGRLLYTLSTGEHGYTAVTRIYADRLGSTRATQTQEWIWNSSTTRNYYPYGEEIGTPTANNAFKFAGTYRDAVWDGSQYVATGLDYAINRYYASTTARFTIPDPLGHGAAKLTSPISWNLYVYSRNDPVNLLDASGLDASGAINIAEVVFEGRAGTFCDESGQYAGKVVASRNGNQMTQAFYNEKDEWLGSDVVTVRGGNVVILAAVGPDPGGGIQTQTYTGAQGFLSYDGTPGRRHTPEGSRGKHWQGQGQAFAPASMTLGSSSVYTTSGRWDYTNGIGQSTHGTYSFSVTIDVGRDGIVKVRQEMHSRNEQGEEFASSIISEVFDEHGRVSVDVWDDKGEGHYRRCPE